MNPTSLHRSELLAEALCRLARSVPGLTVDSLRAHPALAGLAASTVDRALDIATGPGTRSGWLLVDDATGVLIAVREQAA